MKWAQWQGISQVLKELSLYLESTSSTISHFEECNWSIQQNRAWERLFCFKASTTFSPSVRKQLSQQQLVACCDWSKFARLWLHWHSSQIKAGYFRCSQSNECQQASRESPVALHWYTLLLLPTQITQTREKQRAARKRNEILNKQRNMSSWIIPKGNDIIICFRFQPQTTDK